MSLDPTPSPARLREMAEERMAKRQKGQPLTGPPSTTQAPDQLTLTLPWSALHSQTASGFFGAVSKRYKAALAKARAMVADQLGPYAQPVLGSDPVSFVLVLYVPNHQRRDAANYLKLLQDCLTGLVYADDSQCVVGSWRTMLDVDRPRAEVTVTRDLTLALGYTRDWRTIELKGGLGGHGNAPRG